MSPIDQTQLLVLHVLGTLQARRPEGVDVEQVVEIAMRSGAEESHVRAALHELGGCGMVEHAEQLGRRADDDENWWLRIKLTAKGREALP